MQAAIRSFTARTACALTAAAALLVPGLFLMAGGCTGTVSGKSAGNHPDAGDTAQKTDAASGGTSDSGVAASADAGTLASGGAKDSGVDKTSDAGAKSTADAGKVSIFVAQGHKGRLTISCDDGKTWIADRNTDSSVHCFDPATVDCDHDPEAARGLAYGNGYFVATFGWGTPGHIARTTNGIDWPEFPQTQTFAGLAFGNGVFVANDHTPAISTDGKTWTPGGVTTLIPYNVRAIGFTAKNGGRFVVTGETNTVHDVVYSKDNAKSWVHPTTLPAGCGAGETGIAASDEIVVIAHMNGLVCSSADGGDTWTSTMVGSAFTSPPVWTGNEFMVWQMNTLFRSSDGKTWTTTSITPSTVHIGQVAANKKGTLVAVDGDWDAWYDKQEFYRSVDGVTWEVLPKTAFTGGHPIYFIEAGEVDASAKCPAP